MRIDAYRRIERHRITTGKLASDSSDGNNGAFMLPIMRCGDGQMVLQETHYKPDVTLGIVVSDGEDWDHVSVSLQKRCPSWDEMCFVKDLFFEPEEAVMQLHPPKSDYVNHHPFCLHLWRPQNKRIPLPPSIFVGPKVAEATR